MVTLPLLGLKYYAIQNQQTVAIPMWKSIMAFSPGYRLAWLKPFPTLVEDCFAVLKYVDPLSKKHGNLTLIWQDAHVDLNAPDGSISALFYGMPLRSIMDDHCFGLLENPSPLKPSQVIT